MQSNNMDTTDMPDMPDQKPDNLPKSTEQQASDQDARLREVVYQKGTEELASRVIKRGKEKPQSSKTDRQHQLNVDTELASSEIPEPADDAPVLMFLCGSPRRHTCASLIDLLELGARKAGVKTKKFMLCEHRIDPCTGCSACNKTGNCAFKGSSPIKGMPPDDYSEFLDMLDSCDGLAVVAPVYFAGPTAQLKALYDRFQPYWVRKYLLGMPFPKRRSSQLFIVGTGGDPHGYEPVSVISRSALQIAGFELDKINNFIGYLAPSDAPLPFGEAELENKRPLEITANKEAVFRQEEMRKRAVEAGKAFGRLLIKEKASRS